MSENTAHCLAMWSDVRKLEHITQQYKHCSRNHNTSLENMSDLQTVPTIIIQTVAESEEIETNHLEFAKSLFQHYYTYLGLTNNSWPTKSAFNCYINERIVYHLEGQGDPEFIFNNFFSELLQSTTLSQNYLFRFPITFVNKGKGRLQTPAETPKQIQLLTWKKQRFDSPANSSYYHTPGSTINIINTVTTSTTMPLNRILFQSKQKKTELLETYDFRAISSSEITNSKEEESSDQKVNKQNLILKHSEIKTLHLPPVIVINPLSAPPNTQQQQQPQPLSQQQI
ncbi:hypothetical protein G9A89_022961 [Geosiphon pyriformis]|nr:hypothetical protein G9A89_022961 [Geosiphon pyriformis]